MWPVVILGFEWYRAEFNIGNSAVRRLAPFFLVSLGIGLWNIFWSAKAAQIALRGDGFVGRLVGAGQIAGFYLYNAVVPVHLSFMYPRWAIDPSDFFAW